MRPPSKPLTKLGAPPGGELHNLLKASGIEVSPLRATSAEEALSEIAIKCFLLGYLDPNFPLSDVPPLLRKIVLSLRDGQWPRLDRGNLEIIRGWQTESRRNQRRVGGDITDFELPVDIETPFEAAWRNERRQLLQAALASLRPHHRNVIILRYFHGLSLKEAAETLGVTPGRVTVWIFRAMHGLRNRLAHLESDEPAHVVNSTPCAVA